MKKNIRKARQYIKASMRPERTLALAKIQNIAEGQTLIELQNHYLRTGQTILQLEQYLKKKGIN